MAGVPGVQAVDANGDELVITATDGAATIGPVAVALAAAGIAARTLTLRTPTLDDVFLELTGTHIRPDERIAPETVAGRPRRSSSDIDHPDHHPAGGCPAEHDPGPAGRLRPRRRSASPDGPFAPSRGI